MGKSWTELYLEAVARADKAEEEYMEKRLAEFLAKKRNSQDTTGTTTTSNTDSRRNSSNPQK